MLAAGSSEKYEWAGGLVDTRFGAGYAARWTSEGISGEKTVTEAEWLGCTDPAPMLKFLHGKASERKVRLFVCARARALSRGDPFPPPPPWAGRSIECSIRDAERKADSGEAFEQGAIWWVKEPNTHAAAAQSLIVYWNRLDCCTTLRCIFGNPFRPVCISPVVVAWNDAAVARLAQAAYEKRNLPEGTLDNGLLAVLADALEEAGCTDADILGHLRGPGPHVRGCWPVDLCLGKF
jgi:hypothetical protein